MVLAFRKTLQGGTQLGVGLGVSVGVSVRSFSFWSKVNAFTENLDLPDLEDFADLLSEELAKEYYRDAIWNSFSKSPLFYFLLKEGKLSFND